MDATRRAKACLDDPGTTRERWVQTDILVVQEREVCSAVGRLPQSVRWKARRKRNSTATRDRAHPADAARGCNVQDVRVIWIHDDRTNRTAIESRAAISWSRLNTESPRRKSVRGIAIDTRTGGNTRVRSKVRPGIAAVGRPIDSKSSFRISRRIRLTRASV